MISPLSKIEFYKFHLTHKIWFQRCQKMNYFFNQISTAVVRIRKLNKWNHVDGTWHLIPTCLAPQNTIDYYSKTHEGVHALGNGKFKRWIFLALFQPFSWRLPSLPAPPLLPAMERPSKLLWRKTYPSSSNVVRSSFFFYEHMYADLCELLSEKSVKTATPSLSHV